MFKFQLWFIRTVGGGFGYVELYAFPEFIWWHSKSQSLRSIFLLGVDAWVSKKKKKNSEPKKLFSWKMIKLFN